jgi:chitinase
VPSGVTLTNGWGAIFAVSGTTWTMTGPSYALSLAPNASFSFGFQGAGPSSPAPSNIVCS